MPGQWRGMAKSRQGRSGACRTMHCSPCTTHRTKRGSMRPLWAAPGRQEVQDSTAALRRKQEPDKDIVSGWPGLRFCKETSAHFLKVSATHLGQSVEFFCRPLKWGVPIFAGSPTIQPACVCARWRGVLAIRLSKGKNSCAESDAKNASVSRVQGDAILPPIFLAFTTKVFKYPGSETAVTALTF